MAVAVRKDFTLGWNVPNFLHTACHRLELVLLMGGNVLSQPQHKHALSTRKTKSCAYDCVVVNSNEDNKGTNMSVFILLCAYVFLLSSCLRC